MNSPRPAVQDLNLLSTWIATYISTMSACLSTESLTGAEFSRVGATEDMIDDSKTSRELRGLEVWSVVDLKLDKVVSSYVGSHVETRRKVGRDRKSRCKVLAECTIE
jgi:hypothetical protein